MDGCWSSNMLRNLLAWSQNEVSCDRRVAHRQGDLGKYESKGSTEALAYRMPVVWGIRRHFNPLYTSFYHGAVTSLHYQSNRTV